MDGFATIFRDRLESLRHTTASGESFFVTQELRGLVTESIVNDITRPWIPEQRRSQIVDIILEDGVRLLCALVVLNRVEQISNFLSHNTLDSRLPIKEKAELRTVTPELDDAFYSTVQWQFFPWVLGESPGHIILPENTVIPFIQEIFISEGSGGVLDLVTVPGQMQKFRPDQVSWDSYLPISRRSHSVPLHTADK